MPQDYKRFTFNVPYMTHYMNNMLLAHNQDKILLTAYANLQQTLKKQGLIIPPKKVQTKSPYSYLGHKLYPKIILPQKIQIRKDRLKTSNDFQKLFKNINWLIHQVILVVNLS